MPTYDYECDACDHKWELFQKMSDDPVKTCPECKKRKARRLFGTGAAIVFKGSGFYQTDYRSDSYKKAEKAESESKGEGKAKKSESNAESTKKPEKSAASPEPKAGKKTKSSDSD